MQDNVPEKKLPGRPRSTKEARDEFDKNMRARLVTLQMRHGPERGRALAMVGGRAEQQYRWRIQLACGCTEEVLTMDEDVTPLDRTFMDSSGRPLLKGEAVCLKHERAAPYRRIAEWVERSGEAAPDPVEPQGGMAPETWAKVRHTQPRSVWTVRLACGHPDQVHADPAWTPADGHRRRTVSDEQISRLAAVRSVIDDEELYGHWMRMYADGDPRPPTETRCMTCAVVRDVVAYERVGWLVPRTPEPKRPLVRRSRESMERRLARIEAEAGELRRELADRRDDDDKQQQD